AGLAAAAVAVAEVPRRNADRRSRAQSLRAGLRVRQEVAQNQVPVLAAAAGSSGTAPAVTPGVAAAAVPSAVASAAPASSANPFRPPPVDSATRPWPRAVLPGYQTSGAMTAAFDSSAAAPSFYPFEPNRSAAAELALPTRMPPPAEPDAASPDAAPPAPSPGPPVPRF
ncbi:hypothetical protein SNE32_07905, partial [Lysobacter sp. D1-1-M9]